MPLMHVKHQKTYALLLDVSSMKNTIKGIAPRLNDGNCQRESYAQVLARLYGKKCVPAAVRRAFCQ